MARLLFPSGVELSDIPPNEAEALRAPAIPPLKLLLIVGAAAAAWTVLIGSCVAAYLLIAA